MSYWVLPVSGIPISCVNVLRLTEAEQQTNEYQKQMKLYDEHLSGRLNIRSPFSNISSVPDWNRLSLDESDPDFAERYYRVINDSEVIEADDRNNTTGPVPIPDIYMTTALIWN